MDIRAAFIAGTIIKFQRAWAIWMQRRADKLSSKGKTLMLFFFCGVSVLVSAALIYRNIRGTVFHLQVSSISRPSLPTSATINKPDTNSITRIIRFRKYMDSLSGNKNGKRKFDSIQEARPGLLDSAILLEKIYKSER
jgi:hypothetical protein